jgi:hypothetical protein
VKPESLELRSNPRRPVHRLVLDCSPFGTKTKDGGATLVKAALKLIRAINPEPESIIDLQLTGELMLKRIELDPTVVSSQIEEQSGVRFVTIDSASLNLGNQPGATDGDARELTREDLEKEAIGRLLKKENLFGLENSESEFAELFYEIKEAVRVSRRPAELAEQIGASALIDCIVTSRSADPVDLNLT